MFRNRELKVENRRSCFESRESNFENRKSCFEGRKSKSRFEDRVSKSKFEDRVSGHGWYQDFRFLPVPSTALYLLYLLLLLVFTWKCLVFNAALLNYMLVHHSAILKLQISIGNSRPSNYSLYCALLPPPMKKLLLAFTLSVCSIALSAQSTFIKIFSDFNIADSLKGVHVVQTADTNFSFVCDNSLGNIIIRIDPAGNEFRRFSIGDSGQHAACIAADLQNNYFVIGQDERYFTAYLLRADSSGNTTFSRTQIYGGVGSTIGLAVYTAPDNLFAYQIWSDDPMCNNPLTIYKVDANNNTIWGSEISPNSWNYSREAIRFTGNDRFASVSTIILNCYDQFPTTASVLDTSFQNSANYVTTLTDNYVNIDTVFGQGYILSNNSSFSRTDLTGTILWTKAIPFSGTNISLKTLPDSTILIAGNAQLSDEQIVLCKMDSQGNLIWSKNFGGAGDEKFSNLVVATDGGYLLSGTTYSFGNRKAILIKTDSSGSAGVSFPLLTSTYHDLCFGDSLQLSLASGYTYLWNNNSTTQSIIINSAGSYSATLTAPDSTQVSDSISVVSYFPTMVTLGPDIIHCDTTSLVLNAGSGFQSYVWNNASANSFDTAFTSGVYSVTVRDSHHCIASDAIHVEIKTLPSFDLGPDSSYCTNNALVLSSPLINNWQWNSGSSDSTISVTQSGIYSISYNNGFCSATDSIQLSISPAANINITNDTLVCINDTLTLNPGAGYASYLWQDSSSNQTFPVSSTIVATNYYSVLVTDTNGCKAFDDVVIDFDFCLNVNELFSENNFVIYPTLVKQNESISISSETIFSIHLNCFDALGKEIIKNERLNLPAVITANTFPAGIYYLILSGENYKNRVVKKIIVQ